MSCRFDKAWQGPCGKPSEGDYCPEHAGLVCVVTGRQATHTCSFAGQFVCGANLADNVIHTDGWAHAERGEKL